MISPEGFIEDAMEPFLSICPFMSSNISLGLDSFQLYFFFLFVKYHISGDIVFVVNVSVYMSVSVDEYICHVCV